MVAVGPFGRKKVSEIAGTHVVGVAGVILQVSWCLICKCSVGEEVVKE